MELKFWKRRVAHALKPTVEAIEKDDHNTLAQKSFKEFEQTLDGERRLMDIAAECGSVNVLAWAIDAGANINTLNRRRRVPLHYAISSPKSYDVVKLLLEKGAKIDEKMPGGDLPIHKACACVKDDVLRLLLENGADVMVKGSNDMTPLHRACLNDLKDHVAVIINHLKNPKKWKNQQGRPVPNAGNAKDNKGKMVKQNACVSEAIELGEVTGDHQQTPEEEKQSHSVSNAVNATDSNGQTALHIAAKNHNSEIVTLLLDNDGDLSITDKDGLTPMDFILKNKYSGVLNEIIFHITSRACENDNAKDLHQLLNDEHSHRLVEWLRQIDIETSRCCCDSPKSNKAKEIIEDLVSFYMEGNCDVSEFNWKMNEALKTKEIHELSDQNLECVAKLTAKYVMQRDDKEMLQAVMNCGPLWTKIQVLLECKPTLYDGARTKTSQVSGLFQECFTKEDSVLFEKLGQRVHKAIGMRNLVFDWDKEDKTPSATRQETAPDAAPKEAQKTKCERENVKRKENPLQSPVIWSILSGNWSLTLMLLKRTEVDIIPLSLLAAGILRKLPYIFNTTVALPSTDELASRCEHVACNAVKMAADCDMSAGNRVTYSFLLLRMQAFGGLNCMSLAANCECDTFLRLKVSQKAMGVMWNRFTDNMSSPLRTFLAIMAIVPFNPVLPIVLYNKRPLKRHSKKATADSEKPDSSAVKKAKRPVRDIDAEESGGLCTKVARFFGYSYYFYQIPSIKYRYFTVSLLVQLLLLSYVLLTEFTHEISYCELASYGMAAGFLLEELRELLMSACGSRFRDYLLNKWNIFDILCSLCMSTAFALRMLLAYSPKYTLKKEDIFDHTLLYLARFFYSFTCLLLWMQLLNIVRVSEYFGPKLKMISLMIINDLIPYLYIMFIFIFGFGVFMSSMTTPAGHFANNLDEQLTFLGTLKRIILVCFYSIFGEYPLDYLTGKGCEDVYYENSTIDKQCPHKMSIILVPYVLLPVYIIITTVLLPSLVVALFTKTIDKIDCNSLAVWQFERFALISEYDKSSSLPPPLNVLDMIRSVISSLCCCLPKNPVKEEMDFFNHKMVVRHLINQAIGLRNEREKLTVKEDDSINMKQQMKKLLEKMESVEQRLPDNRNKRGLR